MAGIVIAKTKFSHLKLQKMEQLDTEDMCIK